MGISDLTALHHATHLYGACPRLSKYCKQVAREKRKAYRDQTYWGRPVSGFGDPQAQLVIVGLAPAAHGANRTGRVFTGDRSGDWLYRALHKSGFANQSTSTSADDGLILKNAYVTCVVKCAPPDNRPETEELIRCGERHLAQEIEHFENAPVWLALGQVALHGLWPWLHRHAERVPPRPDFAHAARLTLPPLQAGGRSRSLLMSYHPSQQNTFTGRLTESMFDSVFDMARALVARNQRS